ncbi:hypothetical protein ZIOFF_067926 [Zingiber officinale]|uniref:HAT C-terminal dimerisation domain-containing protein n=1 Tax=Zingiber officinale TaxID=94328 RepID=A0A8J5EUV1_ZINOF|nr:hypothetical protein ZIOFF_067926 [Zingiber officinale]
MSDSAPTANLAIQASLDSNEISEQIIDKKDSVTNNLIEDDNLLHKSRKQKRSLVWSDMIEIEDPKGDKYKCKHCNLFLAKMKSESNIKEVQRLLYAIYKEYSDAAIEKLQGSKSNSESQDSNTSIQSNREHTTFSFRWTEFSSYLKEIEMIQPEKFELDVYLKEGCHRHNPNDAFDALGWWKLNTYKFLVLSSLARDILAIPISTVASEATFSAGGYVIDKYRASLAHTTIEMLILKRWKPGTVKEWRASGMTKGWRALEWKHEWVALECSRNGELLESGLGSLGCIKRRLL